MITDERNTAAIRLDWLLAAVQDPSSLTTAEIDAAYDPPEHWRDWSPEGELDFLTNGPHGRSRPLTVVQTTFGDEHDATAILVGADGKRFSLTCWSEPQEPHRVTGARLVPAPPEGMTIRLATEEDGPALAELERRAPLRLGSEPLTFMTFDHGDDYFGPSRLMDDVTVYVGEYEGRLVGVYCGAVQPVDVDGERKRLFLEHHVRIDPEAPRGGVFWALCSYGRDRYARSTDSIAFYVSVDNLAVRKIGNLDPGWSVQPLRALIPCRADDGLGDVGRPASEADARAVVETLNACHTGAALFAPYTEDSLARRLAHDPDQYGWGSITLGDGAVVGVGGQLVTVTTECEGERTVTVRATALDHGFAPGHEDDYRALLRSTCRRLADQGATHLVVFTSERSATYGVISEQADAIEVFDFWAFEIPEPTAALIGHGFYVDPVYF